MAESRLVDEWIEKAEEDFQFAASVLEDSTFYAQICFHFHQAAEKYLKVERKPLRQRSRQSECGKRHGTFSPF